MLRVAAALALLLGVSLLLAYLQLLGEGPWASPQLRHLRAMKERAAPPARYQPFTLLQLDSLSHGRPVAEYATLERRGVSVEGWVQRLLRASDGDIHLEVAFTPRTAGGPDTLYMTAEVTPRFSRGSRAWSLPGLLETFRPNHGGATPWDRGPARVRISGWLLYDFQYDTPPSEWSRRYGAPRASGWEIHPVTRIERWDDARETWAEVPR